MDLRNIYDEGDTFLWNIRNHLTSSTVPYPWQSKRSMTPLCKYPTCEWTNFLQILKLPCVCNLKSLNKLFQPVPVTARSKAKVCGRSPAEILGFKSHRGHGCLSVVECCVSSGRGLCDQLIARPEESYRLWCCHVWSRNPVNEEALDQWGMLCQIWKKKSYFFKNVCYQVIMTLSL